MQKCCYHLLHLQVINLRLIPYVHSTTMCQLGWARSDRVFHQQPLLPSLTPLGTKSEREGEREAEILLQGIHLITETELIAS